jgi:gluconolactonase
VVDGRSLAEGRVFCDIKTGNPDGFRIDVTGNLWTSTHAGVECYAPDGSLLGRINVPEIVANVTFGGRRRNRLFITATTSLYAIYVNTTGVQRP